MNKNRLNIRKRDEARNALIEARKRHVNHVKDMINPGRNIRKLVAGDSESYVNTIIPKAKMRYDQMEVILVPDNTVDATIKEYQKQSKELAEHYHKTKEMLLPRIMVLDFASFKRPGGGFMTGSTAQEESLCERTDLYPYLDNRRASSWYVENKRFCKDNYLKPAASLYNDNQILVSDVRFFDNREIDVATASVLVTAAPNHKAYIDGSVGGNYPVNIQEYMDALESRIRSIFWTAYNSNFDTLILGAFGCGVFGNNARDVSFYFYQYIKKFAFMFKRIIFAIPNNTRLPDVDTNFGIFNHSFLYNFNLLGSLTSERKIEVSADSEQKEVTYVFKKLDNAKTKQDFKSKLASAERIYYDVKKETPKPLKARGMTESIIFRGR